jgi:hypothetical protein
MPNIDALISNLRRLDPTAPEMFSHQRVGNDMILTGDRGTVKNIGTIPTDPKTGRIVQFFKTRVIKYKGKDVEAQLTPHLEWYLYDDDNRVYEILPLSAVTL